MEKIFFLKRINDRKKEVVKTSIFLVGIIIPTLIALLSTIRC